MLAALPAACGQPRQSTTAIESASASADLPFRPDPGVGREIELCFGFRWGSERPRLLQEIAWRQPEGSSPVTLHHAKLYAVTDLAPGLSCEDLPDAGIPLHAWLPGSPAFRMPDGVALEMPPATRALVIEAHVLRTRDGPAPEHHLRLRPATNPALTRAHFAGLRAPVPPIPPGRSESSTLTCLLSRAHRLHFVWPHMHALGKSLRVDLLGPDDLVTPLLDIALWDVHRQTATPLDVEVGAGQRLRVECLWENHGDHLVGAGPRADDEMCAAGFIVEPAPVDACLQGR